MSKIKFQSKQRTGNMGLFYICYKLSRFGWNVLPTIKNAKAIDIIAYKENGEQPISIQTKGFTNVESVGKFRDEADIAADFYIITTNIYERPVTYILTKSDVKKNLTKNEDGHWLEKSSVKGSDRYYLKDEFRENWEKIGMGFALETEVEQIKRIDKELSEEKNREGEADSHSSL